MSAMPEKPLGNSSTQDRRPEEFRPPEITGLSSLTDGRMPGDYQSKYPYSAWMQIAVELVYLLGIVSITIGGLVNMALAIVLGEPHTFFPSQLGNYPANSTLLVWLAAGLAGACGGASSSLKWLYHSVAKQQWHRDRFVWRIVVPPISAVLSVFAGLMIVSGLIPFFSKTSFDDPATGAAFGFFAGLFSDNLLAALQNLAHSIFGTVSERKSDK